VAAAQAAQSGVSLHMGVGSGDGTGDEMARVWRARESGPLLPARHTGQRDAAGVSTGLLWATAHAARVSGREPADVWAEALDAWLAGWEHDGTSESSEHRAADGRRLRAWQAIDTTLGQLRAS
jgi:hypothetical protein